MSKNQIRQSQAIHTFAPGAIGDFPELSLMFLAHDAGGGKLWGNNDNLFKEDSQQKEVVNLRRRTVLKDKRLTEAFGIEAFVYPPINTGTGEKNNLNTIRFPFSLYCSNPKCGRLYKVSELIALIDNNDLPDENYNLHQKAYRCPECYANNPAIRAKLIPTRFVIATEEGYIDDFPWDWYVHQERPDQRGNGHKLYLKFSGGSSSLGSIKIVSKDRINPTNIICSRTLDGIFDQERTFMSPENNYLSYVNNRLPAPWKGWTGGNISHEAIVHEVVNFIPGPSSWGENGEAIWDEHINPREAKRRYPRTLQRGAGNLYFPIVFKAILLPVEYEPEYSGDLNDILTGVLNTKKAELDEEDLQDFDSRKHLLKEKIYKLNSDSLYKKTEYKIQEKEYTDFIDKVFLAKTEKDDNTSSPSQKRKKLRQEEFSVFINTAITEDATRWYKARHMSGEDYKTLSPFIEQITLLDKLNEIKILRGFTRIRPLSNEDLIFADDSNVADNWRSEYDRIQDARMDPKNTREFPCVDVKGEGIFIKFRDSALIEWASRQSVNSRIKILQKNTELYDQTFGGESCDERKVNPIYVLLHSISHMLLRELSIDTGYSLSSLGEIIYCSDKGDDPMHAILIYTSANDSEGTMGGLVEKGTPSYFEKLFVKALERMKWCSSDPLCITTKSGQGFMGLNLSACHACSLLPETACENMNRFLDRALLVGELNETKETVESTGFFQGTLL